MKMLFRKIVTVVLVAGCVGASAVAWAGPKGPQYVPLEQLKDEKNLQKAVELLTDDTKGKQFGKVKKVVIPSYYVEFRTTSSGRVVKKGLLGQHGVAVNATVSFGNADAAVMQSIATAALADLKERLAAAGYEVVNPGDITALEPYKKLKPFPSGKITDSTVKQVGFSDFKAMFAAAESTPIYFSGVTQDPEAATSPHFDGAAVDGMVWEQAGGEGVGVLRPKIVVEFVNFIGETYSTSKKDYDIWGNKVEITTDHANISAIPQVKIYSSSLSITRTYVKVIGNTYADNVGSVYVNANVELASTASGPSLGSVDDKDGKWVFTANMDKYKEAALDQLKVFNALMVGKAKTFK